MLLNLSCPAVSHNCNFIGVPSATLSTRAKKSTPTVGSETSKNEPSVKHLSRELFPTPESPIRMTLRLGFCEKEILSILSYFLSREKLTHKKSWAILQNFNLWMIKFQLYKKNILALGNLAKLVCWSIVSSFANWSASGSSHFWVSFSRERKYERVEKKFKTQNPIPRERICTAGTANIGSQDVTCTGTGLELEETCGGLKCPEPHCPDGYQYSSK